jgi:penicillin-binding protein 1C
VTVAARRWLRGGLAASIHAAAGAWLRLGPLPEGFLESSRFVSTEIVDRRGEPLYESLSEEGGRNRWLAPDALPPHLVHATLAAEDARFFSHVGVDPLAVARAAWHNLRSWRGLEGGSTLTQQVAKQLSHRPRTVAGKAKEVVLALRLEHRLPKREILALYLNVAPYGHQYVGAAAASWGYFGCAPENLTPAQAALLAALPQRPSALDPFRHFEKARARQRWVLGRMQTLGYLSPSARAQAEREALRLVRASRSFLAPHFVAGVLDSVGDEVPARIETTLDAQLQSDVRGILAAHRPRLRSHGARHVAVAVLDNATGEWRAWEGSGDYQAEEGAIDGVSTPRQPGSALKPFTYALAFEKGLTPASVLPDVPSDFPTAEPGVLYKPRNYDGVFRGPLRARAALAGSENVPAVWALKEVGVTSLLRFLRTSGFSTLDRTADVYGFALTMGDAEVRLDELVNAYAMLARGGLFAPTRSVRAVVSSAGAREAAPPVPPPVRRISEQSAFWIADILADARARAYIFGEGSVLEFPFPVAVKTGTSQAYHDNWTIGFTRDVTVGVWVGNFDRTPLAYSTGVTGAAPILHDALIAAQRRVRGRIPDATEALLPPPAGLARTAVCALSGEAPTPACRGRLLEWLPASAPLPACRWHRAANGRTSVDWPAIYRPWAAERGLLAPAGTRTAEAALRIVNPGAGATYLIDPTLPSERQTLALRAASSSTRELRWTVNGRPVGTGHADGALDWPLERGVHVVTVSDDRGHRDTARIEVR